MVLFIFISGLGLTMAYAWVWWRGYQRLKYLQQAELFWEKAGKTRTAHEAAAKRHP